MQQRSVSEIAPWNSVDQTFDEGVMDKPIEDVKEMEKPIEEAKNQDKQISPLQNNDNQLLQESPEKKTKNSYKINTTKSRSELKLLKKVIHRNGWKEDNLHDNGDIMWLGMTLKEEDYECAFKMHINRFPGMRDLAQKDQTGFFLNKFREYFPDDFDFFPKSYLIPQQQTQFELDFKEDPDKLYISKPDAGSQGDGIFLIKQLKDINYSKGQVIQEYIKNPLLIDGKKFDLRIYVLISSLEPFICYLNDEGLARFCTVDYETPSNDNLKNSFMHLTNYSLNKESPNFVLQTTDFMRENLGSKRTITSIKKNLTNLGFNVDQIMTDIEDIVVKFLTSLHPFLMYNFKAVFQAKTDQAKCFHILGFDILLDSDAKPWLLEINGNPSLNIDHEYLGKDGKPIVEVSPLDEYVKTKVMEDAIAIIVRKPEKQIENIGLGESFYSYKMLIDGELESDEKDLVQKMLTIYTYLCGYKFRETLTASKFIKLASFQGMQTPNFIKTDYNLLFIKILLKEQVSQMNFFYFIEAIERIAQKLITTFDAEDKLPGVTELVNNILQHIQ